MALGDSVPTAAPGCHCHLPHFVVMGQGQGGCMGGHSRASLEDRGHSGAAEKRSGLSSQPRRAGVVPGDGSPY